MSSSQRPASEQQIMEPSEPAVGTDTIPALQQAKELTKDCEKALSLPSKVGEYTRKIFTALSEVKYKVDDVSETVAVVIIMACRQHKFRRSLSEILEHLSAPMTDTLTLLWKLEHLDVQCGILYTGREFSVTCEESTEPDAFCLTKDGSMSKIAVTLRWPDNVQVLLHGKYNTMSKTIKDLRIRALGRPMPYIMSPAEVNHQEEMEEVPLSEDEVDDWEEITLTKRGMRAAKNGEPLVKEDGEVKQLVDRLRQGLAVGVEFVEAMVNGDTSLIKGDTSMIG